MITFRERLEHRLSKSPFHPSTVERVRSFYPIMDQMNQADQDETTHVLLAIFSTSDLDEVHGEIDRYISRATMIHQDKQKAPPERGF